MSFAGPRATIEILPDVAAIRGQAGRDDAQREAAPRRGHPHRLARGGRGALRRGRGRLRRRARARQRFDRHPRRHRRLARPRARRRRPPAAASHTASRPRGDRASSASISRRRPWCAPSSDRRAITSRTPRSTRSFASTYTVGAGSNRMGMRLEGRRSPMRAATTSPPMPSRRARSRCPATASRSSCSPTARPPADTRRSRQ